MVYFYPHQVLAVLVRYIFEEGKRGLVMKNFAASWILDRLREKLGFAVTTTPVSFKWVKEES